MDEELELLVARKCGLYWSKSVLLDENGVVLVDGTYLYYPEQFWSIFFELFDKLHQLNDYCFNQLIASEAKLGEFVSRERLALENQSTSAEELDFYSEQIPFWENTSSVFSKAMPIILLSSFSEWGLKFLLTRLFGNVPRKLDRSISDIQFYLNHLIVSGIDVPNPEGLMAPINTFRRVRNDFAHGRWHELDCKIDNLSLRDAFSNVSMLFAEVEKSAWKFRHSQEYAHHQ